MGTNSHEQIRELADGMAAMLLEMERRNVDLQQQLAAATNLITLAETSEAELQCRVNELESECRSLREELDDLRSRQPPERKRPWWAQLREWWRHRRGGPYRTPFEAVEARLMDGVDR